MHQRIGKYHVIRAAGSGGFGTVYEGYDVELDRNVAIKICASGEESQLERFRREARIVSRLKHRNIALVYDFGFDEKAGVHYLVEEFLSGVDLEKKLEERDRLPASLRLRYLIGLAQGLEFVHDNGLIHRDLSPHNIRVLHDHTIKIMDFGLAKDVTDSTLTLVGDNFGTIGYTAPEQLAGMRNVDQRTDIFSLGVIAYELLTCSNPFMADTMGHFIHKIHHFEPRPLAEVWADCPADLAAVVHECISKTPDDRPASCSEILPLFKKTLRHVRDPSVSVPFSPPAQPDEVFEKILAAVDDEAEPESRGEPDGVDTAGEAAPARGKGVPTKPLPEMPAGGAPAVRRRFLPRYLVGLAAVAAILVYATLRPGSENASPPDPNAEPPAAEAAFVLRTQLAGTPEKPAVQLLAELPRDLEGLSHCYVLRTPSWASGEKIRRDCRGEALRHLDRDVRFGERFTYQVHLANAAGEVLLESSWSSVVTRDGK